MNNISISDISKTKANQISDLAHSLGLESTLRIDDEVIRLGPIFRKRNSVDAGFTLKEVMKLANKLVNGDFKFNEPVEGEFGIVALNLLKWRFEAPSAKELKLTAALEKQKVRAKDNVQYLKQFKKTNASLQSTVRSQKQTIKNEIEKISDQLKDCEESDEIQLRVRIEQLEESQFQLVQQLDELKSEIDSKQHYKDAVEKLLTEQTSTIKRQLETEVRNRPRECKADVFQKWLDFVLPKVKSEIVYLTLWDDSDDLNSQDQEDVTVVRAMDTKSEKTQLMHRIEKAIGFKTRMRGKGKEATPIYVEIACGSGHGSKLERLLYVSNADNCQFPGIDAIGNHQEFDQKLMISNLRRSAEEIMDEKVFGRTLFEGGMDSQIAQLVVALLVKRISRPNYDDYSVVGKGGKEYDTAVQTWKQTDINLVFEAWKFTILQHDYMSNERSYGTARVMHKNRNRTATSVR